MSNGSEHGVSPRLLWQGVAGLAPRDREELLGPGGRFQLVAQSIGSRRVQVFARRPANLRALFDEAVAAAPDAPFLVAGDRAWTYAHGARDVDAVAGLLADRYGIAAGDRVAFLAANHPEYVLGMLAVQTIGAIATGLNGWWTGAEITYGVELTRPAVLIGDAARLARVERGTLPDDLAIIPLEQLLDEARALGASPPAREVNEQMPALILFTSGTTGRPKGATLSHGNFVHLALTMRFAAEAAARLATAGPAPVDAAPPPTPPHSPTPTPTPTPTIVTGPTPTIVTGPLFHVSGTTPLFAGIAVAATCILTPPGRWDARTFVELTAEHRVSGWGAVPTYYWRILRLPDLDRYDLSCLTKAANGGGPVAPELLRLFAERLPWVAVTNTLGMTETTGLGVTNAGINIAEHPDAVGPPMMTVEAEIRDELGRPVAGGEVGEICFRTASVFLGYWDNPAATAAAVDEDGWYHTGDFGRISDGLVYMDSRRRDMIIRGGENIYPIEIEHRLVAHPAILEAAVIGSDHAELGQEVTAVVVVRPGHDLGSAEVQEWVAVTLAPYKVPAHVVFRASLPYTESGKVMKHELEREDREGSVRS
jgi:acyl-CoA synthetase (AMP-forming)/AMP-acid ligase II